MELSHRAIRDLGAEIVRLYGTDFDLDDGELEEIGSFLLTSLAEVLKHEMRKKE